jgi:hypothetical protein
MRMPWRRIPSKKADVNRDGVVDMADITAIISEIAAQGRMREETTE